MGNIRCSSIHAVTRKPHHQAISRNPVSVRLSALPHPRNLKFRPAAVVHPEESLGDPPRPSFHARGPAQLLLQPGHIQISNPAVKPPFVAGLAGNPVRRVAGPAEGGRSGSRGHLEFRPATPGDIDRPSEAAPALTFGARGTAPLSRQLDGGRGIHRTFRCLVPARLAPHQVRATDRCRWLGRVDGRRGDFEHPATSAPYPDLGPLRPIGSPRGARRTAQGSEQFHPAVVRDGTLGVPVALGFAGHLPYRLGGCGSTAGDQENDGEDGARSKHEWLLWKVEK
jgi:hypothetical protein